MTLETFTTLVVPGIASIAYASASVACLCAGRPALAVMWAAYCVGNIALLMSVKK